MRNLGNLERAIRIAIGIVLVWIGYTLAVPAWGAMAVYVVGAIALLTGAIGFCPAWKLFGINTSQATTAVNR